MLYHVILLVAFLFTPSDNVSLQNNLKLCPDPVRPCVRKCCREGEIFFKRKCTNINSTKLHFDAFNGEQIVGDISDFDVVFGDCSTNETSVLLDPSVEHFYVQKDGKLLLPDDLQEVYLSVDEYCLETFLESGLPDGVVGAVWCVPSEMVETEGEEYPRIMNSIGMIISMPFLLLTFTAYALYPDRNLHMKALMCYVLTLMLGYLVFVIIQLSQSQFDPITCTIMGYGGLFFFTCSFFWMNVICIDIWFTFRGFRGYIGNKNSERKRFYFYMLYAFGMSILHIVVVFCIDSNTDESDWFHPDIGNGQCFLKGGFPELLYFYGPLATIITINVTLYSITAFKIRVIKRETSMLRREDSRRHSYENDKQKFNLYLKLLFGMGVNWSMEVISWAVNWGIGEIPQAIWYITDFCNAIYGVFIFFIFVFRRNVWKLMRKRYYNFIGRPYFGQTTMTGIANATSTNTTSYSLSSSTRAGTENLYTPEPAQPASPAWTSHSDKHEVS